MRKHFALLGGCILLVFYIVSYHAIQAIRADLQIKQHNTPPINIPPVFLKAVSGEFKGIVADYTLIEAASIIGKNEKITEEEWNFICQLFSQSIALDPYFEQSCHLIQGTLPWFSKRYDITISLLNECKNYRYWDWIPGYFIGFDYFYFLKDNQKASEYLMAASTVTGAPPPLATFAARLAQESGSNEIAISFLEMFLMKENDPDKRDMLQKRLDTHKALDILEKGIQAYRLAFGGNPETLQKLVKEGFIKRIPSNPYSGEFIYNNIDGTLKF